MRTLVAGPNAIDKKAEKSFVVSPLPGMTEDEFAELAQSILIMIPHRVSEGINPELAINFGTWARYGTPLSMAKDPHGGFIEAVRGGMVRQFLEYAEDRPQIKYLVMCDADQGIDWDAPYRLCQWDRPVVSGVICSIGSNRGIFANFTIKDKHTGIGRFPSYNYTRRMPSKGIVKADRLGTGLIAVRKDVFEVLDQNGEIPFYIPDDIRRKGAAIGTMKKGEDIVFSEQCEKYGFDRWVDLSVHGSHHKTVAIRWPADALDPNLDVDSWDVSEHDHTY